MLSPKLELLKTHYVKEGYCLVKGFFDQQTLQALSDVVTAFHAAWLADNSGAYRQRELINSAYLTGTKYLSDAQRLFLFQLIGSRKMTAAVHNIIPGSFAFMNTQLFFDPANLARKNYWHRDMQYNGLSVEVQKDILANANIIHCRIPLRSEKGIELVPGSHQNWDSEEEWDVRLQKNGKRSSDALSTGKVIVPDPGDLMFFSANMIHRGLYGLDRMSFDIIFCDVAPEFLSHVDPDCLPDDRMLSKLEEPAPFVNTLEVLRHLA